MKQVQTCGLPFRFGVAAAWAASAATVAALLAACTSSVAPPPAKRASTPPAPATHIRTHPVSAPPTTPSVGSSASSAAPSSSAPRTASSTSNSRPPQTSSAATFPPVAGPQPCPDGTVDVTARSEGALPSEELAQLRFTNAGDTPCTLTGFPGVELFNNGHVLGEPATRSGKQAQTYLLSPGGRPLVATLVDHSQCDAPLSDTVGVYVPNQTVQHRAPLELRGCSLTIDPVRPLH